MALLGLQCQISILVPVIKVITPWSLGRSAVETNPTRIHEDEGSIPGLNKDPVLPWAVV